MDLEGMTEHREEGRNSLILKWTRHPITAQVVGCCPDERRVRGGRDRWVRGIDLKVDLGHPSDPAVPAGMAVWLRQQPFRSLGIRSEWIGA